MGAQTLRFTVSGLTLQGGGLLPADAFEVALLNAETFAPLAGVVNGLGDTEALLNIQPGGGFFKSDTVTVTPAGAGAFEVTIDLMGLTAGTSAVLFFDLIRFGQTGSAATIENLALISRSTPVSQAPVVSAGNDAAIQQGGSLTRNGSFQDPDGADIWTALVDYGDGAGSCRWRSTEPRSCSIIFTTVRASSASMARACSDAAAPTRT